MLTFSRFLTLAAAVSSVSASAATVLAKLKNPVDSTDLPALTSAINAYPSPSPGSALLKVQNANKQLITDINAVTSDASSSAAPTASEAQAIFDFVCGQLYTDTLKVLTALDNKKSVIIQNGAQTATVTELKKTRTAVDNLADVLISKAPTAALKSSGATCKKKYDDAINQRITSFGGTP